MRPPESLATLPEGVKLTTKIGGKADVIQIFATSKKELEANLPSLKGNLTPKGIIWVTYPKGTSKIKSDINRDSTANMLRA